MSFADRCDRHVGHACMAMFLAASLVIGWAGFKAWHARYVDSVCAQAVPPPTKLRVLGNKPDDILTRPYNTRVPVRFMNSPMAEPGCVVDRFGGPRVCSHSGRGWTTSSRSF